MRKIIQTILQAADSGSLTKIIFAGKRKKSLEYSKITLRPVTIRGEYMYQAEFHFEKKVTHQNIPYHEMIDYASQWICEDFKQINILTEAEDIQILAADPENPRITRRAYKKLRKAAMLDHNRKKHYIIEDGKPCDFLIKLGVMSPEAKCSRSTIPSSGRSTVFWNLWRTWCRICHRPADHRGGFGCRQVLSDLCHVLLSAGAERLSGADHRPGFKGECDRHCEKLARAYGYEGLSFTCGDIAGYEAWIRWTWW